MIETSSDFKLFIMTILLFVMVVILFAFVLPMLIETQKRLNCTNHGYFDYNTETEMCWSLSGNEVLYNDVVEKKIFGEYCDILVECIKLRESGE